MHHHDFGLPENQLPFEVYRDFLFISIWQVYLWTDVTFDLQGQEADVREKFVAHSELVEFVAHWWTDLKSHICCVIGSFLFLFGIYMNWKNVGIHVAIR